MDRTLTPPRAPDPEHRDPAPARPAAQPVRRIVMGVLIGALTMFGVAMVDTVSGAQVPLLSSLASLPEPTPPAGPKTIEVPAPPATPGTCLNWARADAADTAVVDCTQPHLFEQAGTVTLADQATVPDDGQWRQLVKERCTPVVVAYLNGKFDQTGRYRVGALKPSAVKWEQGDRELRCGLQSASRSGALYPTTGRVAESDQSPVRARGTCLAIDGKTVGDPIDCARPHAVETVGVVDLSEKFPDAFPAVGDQDAFLQTECGKIANDYAGGEKVIADKKLTVYWDNLTEDSWKAGTHKVNCNLAALLPDRSGFAPVTGPVAGDVTVGETPAPPAKNTPEPGTPAQTGTDAIPPLDGPPSDGGTPAPSPEPSVAPQPPPGDGPPPTPSPPPLPTPPTGT